MKNLKVQTKSDKGKFKITREAGRQNFSPMALPSGVLEAIGTFLVFNFPFAPKREGQALLITVIFLMFASGAFLFTFSSIALRETKSSRIGLASSKSYFLAESGVEDVAWRIKNGKRYDPTENLFLEGAAATTTITASGGQKTLESRAVAAASARSVRTVLRSGAGAAFHYGVQVGEGGVKLGNNSSVVGDVFSNGDIRGGGSGASTITGTAQAAGSHWIENIRVNQNAYAGSFRDCVVGGTAYYVSSFVSCTAGGTSLAEGPLEPRTFPITQAQIDAWKNDAAAGGSLNGYSLDSNSSATLGPKKINGSIKLGNNSTLSLSGAVWVTGTINFGNSNAIRLSPDYGSNSGLVIVDGPVDIGNSANLLGSGTSGGYLMLLSTYAGDDAIEIGNNAAGAVFYAPNGTIDIGNDLSLGEVTAYKLEVGNGSSITYESGLADLNFTSGPTGGWNVENWGETK